MATPTMLSGDDPPWIVAPVLGPSIRYSTRTVWPPGGTRPAKERARAPGSSHSTQVAVGSPAWARNGPTSTRIPPPPAVTARRRAASAQPAFTKAVAIIRAAARPEVAILNI